MGVLGSEFPILRNFAPQKPKIRRIGQPPGGDVYYANSHRKCHATDAPFVQYRNIAGRVDVGRHVLIYGRPRRRTYLFVFVPLRFILLPGIIDSGISNTFKPIIILYYFLALLFQILVFILHLHYTAQPA